MIRRRNLYRQSRPIDTRRHRDQMINACGWCVFRIDPTELSSDDQLCELTAGWIAAIGAVMNRYRGTIIVRSRSLRYLAPLTNYYLLLVVSDTDAATLLGVSTGTARQSGNNITISSMSLTYSGGTSGNGTVNISQTTTAVQLTKRRYLWSAWSAAPNTTFNFVATEETHMSIVRV